MVIFTGIFLKKLFDLEGIQCIIIEILPGWKAGWVMGGTADK